jgi:hypothetical protein
MAGWAGIALGLALAACGQDKPMPPGYYGRMASERGQNILWDLREKTFKDDKDELGGGEWKVGNMIVTPHPKGAGPKQPYVGLSQGEVTVWAPVLCDGDVQDLHRRVHGKLHPDLSGDPGPEYKAAWAAAKQRQGLSCAVRLDTTKGCVATVEFSNSGPREIRLLKWGMEVGADGRLNGGLFSVTRNWVSVPYAGRMVKRAAPTAADYEAVKPGGKKSFSVDLSKDYDLSAPGAYSTWYSACVHEGEGHPPVESPAATFTVKP